MADIFLLPSQYPGGKPGLVAKGSSTARSATQHLPLGTRAIDANGNEYLYVKAGGVIAATDAVKASGTEGLDAVVQSANTATGDPWIGVGHAAFADNEYGFIQIRGIASVKAGNVTAGASVIPKTTAGTFNDLTAADFSTRAAQAVTDDSGGLATIYMP